MSSITLILNDQAGKFSITHRAIGGTTYDKNILEKFQSLIDFGKLELLY